MRSVGGLHTTQLQAAQIQNQVRNLDQLIHSEREIPIRPVDLQSFGLTAAQAEILASLINTDSTNPSPQTFLAAQQAEELNIPLGRSQTLDDIRKEASRPSRPIHRPTKV